MNAYGVKRQDRGCCPGHDKYSPDRYDITSPPSRKRAQRPRKKHARQEARRDIAKVSFPMDSWANWRELLSIDYWADDY